MAESEVFSITFGVQYAEEVHPTQPAIVDPDGWVEVEARDETAARLIAMAVFDRAWSHMYPASAMPAMARSFPRGCIGRLAVAFIPEPEPDREVVLEPGGVVRVGGVAFGPPPADAVEVAAP